MIGFIDISDGAGREWVAFDQIESVRQDVPVGNWESGTVEIITRAGHSYKAKGSARALIDQIVQAYIEIEESS